MNKKEIAEIKKQLTQENCALTRLCGCYVDAEKEKRTEIREAFLSLPEEEIFKYFEIFRKTLSGSVGKNMVNLEFPLEAELSGGAQEFLRRLKESRLTDEALLEAFYDRIIENYEYGENYLILLVHGAYDIPGRSSGEEELFDASDEVYEYLICAICPVKLSKAGLSYNPEENCFESRTRDWLVEPPLSGFLFPAFQDRSTDLHSMLYYSKNPEELREAFVETFLGCNAPLSAGNQKEGFHVLVEEALGEECSFQTVKNIHETIQEMMEERKDEPEPLALDRREVRQILSRSGVEEERLQRLSEDAGEEECKQTFLASNIVDTRKFEIKTPSVVIQVNPERTDLVETRMIDGRRCLVICVDDEVEVNGISLKTFEERGGEE